MVTDGSDVKFLGSGELTGGSPLTYSAFRFGLLVVQSERIRALLFRITAVSPEFQPVKAVGQWTVEADTGEQAISHLCRLALPSPDFWPPGTHWTVDPIESDRLERV